MNQTFQESNNHPSGQSAHFSFACPVVTANEISVGTGGACRRAAGKCKSLDVSDHVGSFVFMEGGRGDPWGDSRARYPRPLKPVFRDAW